MYVRPRVDVPITIAVWQMNARLPGHSFHCSEPKGKCERHVCAKSEWSFAEKRINEHKVTEVTENYLSIFSVSSVSLVASQYCPMQKRLICSSRGWNWQSRVFEIDSCRNCFMSQAKSFVQKAVNGRAWALIMRAAEKSALPRIRLSQRRRLSKQSHFSPLPPLPYVFPKKVRRDYQSNFHPLRDAQGTGKRGNSPAVCCTRTRDRFPLPQ